MKVLITGGSGFVGRYMADECLDHGHEVVLLSLDGLETATHKGRIVPTVGCDIRNVESVKKIISLSQPDAICHLAGLAHVVNSGKDPGLLNDITLNGLLAVCYGALQLQSPTPVLLASSAFVYGDQFQGPTKVNEKTPLNPTTAYGHVKLAAEHLLRSFDGTSICGYIARPFNHIGRGQDTSFVCSAFAKRIKEAKDGFFETGNLDAKRDFSDVRDIVAAYRLILERRPKPNVFVLGRGSTVTIKEIVRIMIEESGKSLTTKVNPQLLRTNDEADISADIDLAKKELGWSCQHTLTETLKEIMA
jgi:GDP-4-dehydro-6-deoxy-D-mannose reductase